MSSVTETLDSAAQQLDFEPLLLLSLAVWLCASHLISLYLSFFICKIGVLTLILLHEEEMNSQSYSDQIQIWFKSTIFIILKQKYIILLSIYSFHSLWARITALLTACCLKSCNYFLLTLNGQARLCYGAHDQYWCSVNVSQISMIFSSRSSHLLEILLPLF